MRAALEAVRVVAGTARGRRLVTPAGRDVRPTLDRVREAVFNSLGSIDALRGATVLDLFAGSGALGIEALSRGADRATFVDEARAPIEAVLTNIEATGLTDRAEVVHSDSFAFLGACARGRVGGYDLVLADPPYGFVDWTRLLSGLRPVLADDAVIVAESDRALGEELSALLRDPGAAILRERRYGGTVVTMITIQVREPQRGGDDRDPGDGRG